MSTQTAKKMDEAAQSPNLVKPYISPTQELPEITLRAIILGICLSMIMAGANAYLGLKMGMSVTATIPAAVISMAILRFFKGSNILENNIVMTTASAGEIIAAATAFTLPALIMMSYWSYFPFWLTTAIVLVGGTLGVLLSVPMRRALLNEKDLKFPEGVATAEVLKIGDQGTIATAKDLLMGGIFAAVVKFCQSGLGILGESVHLWRTTANSLFGVGTGFSLVFVAAGYLVGLKVGLSMLIGGFIAWGIGVPLLGTLNGVPEAGSTYEAAFMIWNSKIRMMGVGTMLVGGLWTIFLLIKPIKQALKTSIDSYRTKASPTLLRIPRTERDIPANYVFMGVALIAIPLLAIVNYGLKGQALGLSPIIYWLSVGIITLTAMAISFICSAIGGYMAGLIGSSNSPISGVTIISVLIISLGMVFTFGADIIDVGSALGMAGLAVMIGGVLSCASGISCENLQDLKAGQIVGATPWKQQLVLFVGVAAAALVMGPIFQVLFEAYGFGEVFPREGMDPTKALMAPKAALIGSLAEGVFLRSLDWQMIIIGATIAVAFILLDEIQRSRGSELRFPILGIAIGIYMSLDITVPVFIGGLIYYLADRKLQASQSKSNVNFEPAAHHARRRGIMFASGLIAGEALIGIVLAFFFAAYQATDIFNIAPQNFTSTATLLGFIIFSLGGWYLYRATTQLRS